MIDKRSDHGVALEAIQKVRHEIGKAGFVQYVRVSRDGIIHISLVPIYPKPEVPTDIDLL